MHHREGYISLIRKGTEYDAESVAETTSQVYENPHAAATAAEEVASLRLRIGQLLDQPESSPMATVIYYSLFVLIFGSTLLTIMDTMPELREHKAFFQMADYFITACFTIELCLRLYVSESLATFFSSCYNVIDIIAVLPGYAELCLFMWAHDSDNMHQAVGSMRTLRITRVVRLIRVIRVVRFVNVNDSPYLEQMVLLFRIVSEAGQTGLVSILMLLGVTTVLAASLIWLCELPLCNEAFGHNVNAMKNIATGKSLSPLGASQSEHAKLASLCSEKRDFDSIPSSWWWALETLTTVGYGDVTPSSGMGKLVGGVMCSGAVMILAIAVSQFAHHFRERWIQVQASSNARRKFAGNTVLIQEQEELEELLADFQQSLDELLSKVISVCLEYNKSPDPTTLLARKTLLRSIQRNADCLNSSLCRYLYEVLSESVSVNVPKHSGSQEPPSPKERRQSRSLKSSLDSVVQERFPEHFMDSRPTRLSDVMEDVEPTADHLEDAAVEGLETSDIKLIDASTGTGTTPTTSAKAGLKLAERLERRLFTT